MAAQVNHAHARIAENGQSTIPASLREELGLEPGASVTVVRVGGSLLVVPDGIESEEPMSRITDFFQSVGVTSEEVMAQLAHIERDEFARRCPAPAANEQRPGMARLFLDSNVFARDIAGWSFDRVVL